MKYKVDGNHIEIYFDDIPCEKIRETLKICGWHWFGKKKCWSNIYNQENLIWAKGVIRCQIKSFYEHRYGEKPEPSMLNKVSPLRKWGYTVSQAAGYSDVQRQGILEDIVDYRIMTKDKVLSYLNFFMKLNHNGSDIALAKWKEDRDYILNYKLGSSKRIRINQIIVHTHTGLNQEKGHLPFFRNM